MHHVKMGGDIFGFIRLNLTNKMPSCLRIRRDFWQGVLQVVLAEIALTGIYGGRDSGSRFGLRHRQQMNRRGRATGL